MWSLGDGQGTSVQSGKGACKHQQQGEGQRQGPGGEMGTSPLKAHSIVDCSMTTR